MVRYKIFENGYKVDKVIVWVALVLVCVYMLITIASNGMNFKNNFYVSCAENIPCKNPFYRSYDNTLPEKVLKLCVYEWCNDEYLPPGFEYGKKPNGFYNFIYIFSFGLIILALVINHFIYNKGKNPMGGLNVD